MSDCCGQSEQELGELLLNGLNEQGFLFQEACRDALHNRQDIGWDMRSYEYPVSLAEQDTRIDIVLRSKSASPPEIYAIVECKRADPNYVHWLFGAPGLPSGSALCSTIQIECRETKTSRAEFSTDLSQLPLCIEVYPASSWIEVKKGTGQRASTPQNIENAFCQVLRGLEGFAHEQLVQRYKSPVPFRTSFIPVVVTTASLYVAYYEARDVDLCTGKIEAGKVLFGPRGRSPEPVEWVLIDYGAGQTVAPNSVPTTFSSPDPADLQKYKTRSIFVVNARSLPAFFSKLCLT